MIRTATSADAEQVLAIYTPIVTDSAISFEVEPPSRDEMATRIERAAATHGWLVCTEGDDVVGYAYAGPFHPRAAYRWSVEVSVYVKEGFQRRGIARRLLEELLRDLTAKGFVNAFAGVALPNPASVKLFESLGFERIALQKKVGFKLGRWHDVGWWQRHLVEPPQSPPPLPTLGDPA